MQNSFAQNGSRGKADDRRAAGDPDRRARPPFAAAAGTPAGQIRRALGGPVLSAQAVTIFLARFLPHISSTSTQGSRSLVARCA